MTTLKDLEGLKNQLVWSKEKWENLFFPVQEQENFVQNVPTGKKTLFRSDRGKVEIISTVGTGYNFVSNEELHKAVSSFDENLKLNMKLSSCWKNKKTSMIYDMKDDNIQVGKDDNDDSDRGLFLKLFVRNSYDGTNKVECELGVFRLKCLNGLAIPIGQTIKMTQKHIGIGGEEEFKKQVHKFLSRAMNDENVKKIKEKIEKSKKETPHIDYQLLKSLPANQLIPVLSGIEKYSTEQVICSFKGKPYDLTDIKQNRMIRNFILKPKEKTERAKNRLRGEIAKTHNMEYNEKISNQWLLYNFIIKVIQYKVAKTKRFDAARRIASYLL